MLHQKLHLSKCVRNCDPCRFVDPRLADINHVVGARGLSDALAEVGHAAGKSFVLCAQDPALLYHFAGRSKDWEAMLETFGLDAKRRSADRERGYFRSVLSLRSQGTRACQEVFDYVDNRSGVRASTCINRSCNLQELPGRLCSWWTSCARVRAARDSLLRVNGGCHSYMAHSCADENGRIWVILNRVASSFASVTVPNSQRDTTL